MKVLCIIIMICALEVSASTDVLSYYLVGYKNTSCDIYISDNLEYYENKISKIAKYYANNKPKNIKQVIDEEEFGNYIKKLSECSSMYRYVGDTNYFISVYAYSLLLLDIVNNPNRKFKESSERVNELVIDILDDIQKIQLSKKISNYSGSD